MNCRSCGRPISDDSVFCHYCGYSITGQMRPAQQQAQAKSGMSVVTIVVVVFVAIILITVVLAAVLYIMVLGFGSSQQMTTPSATYDKSPIANGVEINIMAITKTDVGWGDIDLLLNDGTYFADWHPLTTNLDGGSAISSNLSTQSLGSLTVCCVVFDIAGNGVVNSGDYFELYTYDGALTFASTTWYTVVLVYGPTGETIGIGQAFTG